MGIRLDRWEIPETSGEKQDKLQKLANNLKETGARETGVVLNKQENVTAIETAIKNSKNKKDTTS